MAASDVLPTIDLRTRAGVQTTLADQLTGRPVLVLALRYYGCLPCQHYLVEVHERRAELAERGVDVVVVGVAADFQADHLAATYGIEFPLLLDPGQNLYRALEIPRLRPADFFRRKTWAVYVPLFWRRYVRRTVDGPKQGRIVGDPAQLPGLALLDRDGQPRWVHRGQGLGDYPPLDDVLAIIDDSVTATGTSK